MMLSLITLLAKSSVALLPFLAAGTCRRLSAAQRHAITFTGLLTLPLLVLLSAWLAWQIPLTLPAPELVMTLPDSSHSAAPAQPGRDAGALVSREAREVPELWLPAYGLVLLALCLQAGMAWWRVSRAVSRLESVAAVPAGIALPRAVTLRQGACASPWTWGLFHPVIVLPRAFERWPQAKQRAALLHELAHVRRRDCLSQVLGHVLTILFWFQPLAWMLRRRLGRLAEQAADDHVLSGGSPAADYAQWLVDIARDRDTRTWAGVAMSRYPLSRRIDAVLDTSTRRTPMNSRTVPALALMAMVCTLPVAAVTLTSSLPDERDYVPVAKVKPVYPVAARKDRVEGYAVVEFDVTEHGTTGNVRIVDEYPAGVFADAAARAARQFLYLPARQDGHNVAVSGVRNRITFELAEGDSGATDQRVSVDWEATQTSLQESLADSDPLDAGILARAASAAGAERERNQRLLGDIIARAEADARRTGRGDTYLQAARLASTLQETGYAVHCLLRASELGLDNPEDLKTAVATVLASAGRLDEARMLFAAGEDEASRKWLSHLEEEDRRRSAVYDALARQLQAAVAP